MFRAAGLDSEAEKKNAQSADFRPVVLKALARSGNDILLVMFRTFSILCVLSVPLVAQTQAASQPQPPPIPSATPTVKTPPSTTFGFQNGRMWKALAPFEKFVYVLAIRDALARETEQAQWSKYAPRDEMDIPAAIDRVYSDPQNLAIPIVDALHLAVMTANGESPEVIADEFEYQRELSRRATENQNIP